MKGKLRTALALGLATLLMGQSPNWNAQIVETTGGHRVGNPEASVHLMAFESYTCPHCANFEQQAEGALRIAYIHPGQITLEVRHIIRDPIDLTVVMLANCGPAEKFFDNHRAFMLSQDAWLSKTANVSQATISRWTSTDRAAGRRAIAQDLGLYTILTNRGYTRTDLDRCLNDNQAAQRFANQDAADAAAYGVTATPSFAINGSLLQNVHSWNSLRPQIDERL
jgi:protein-disulfide isomerase